MKRIFLITVILIVCVAISYTMIKQAKQKPLPIINPIDVKKEMVDPELLRIGQGHAIGNFSFLNQIFFFNPTYKFFTSYSVFMAGGIGERKTKYSIHLGI